LWESHNFKISLIAIRGTGLVIAYYSKVIYGLIGLLSKITEVEKTCVLTLVF